MISRVRLTNFQNHRELDLEMGPLTCLTGPSNSGKSAVLRALAGLLRNDSAGLLVTHGEKTLTVEVFLEDGTVVKWVKGGSANDYYVVDAEGNEIAYKKVGAKPPEEVLDVLRIGPIELEGGHKIHLNLHEQQESPFLIMDSPSHVAKVFGELTSAGKLFTAANEGNRRIRSDKKKMSLRQEDLTDLDDQLSEFEGLEQIGEMLAKARDMYGPIAAHQSVIEDWTAVKGRYEEVLETLGEAQTRLEVLTPVKTLSLDALDKLDEASRTLASLREQYVDASQALGAAQERLEILRPVQDLDLDVLDKLGRAIEAVTDVRTRYEIDQMNLSTLKGDLTRQQKDLSDLQDELDEVDECPLCGQELGEDAKTHLLGGAHA